MVDDLAKDVKFNEGGHLNHVFFWESLSPVDEHGGILPQPKSDLHKMLTEYFFSVEGFIERFNEEAAAIQGSGWGWLAYNKDT